MKTFGSVSRRLPLVLVSILLVGAGGRRGLFSELADSSVNFVIRPWVNVADYWPVYFDLTERIKVALEDKGLTIPFPQRDVHLKNGQFVSSGM